MKKEDMMFMIYEQLGNHMWEQTRPTNANGKFVSDSVKTYEPNWRKRMEYARKCGANTVVVDIAEMMQYPSHPEIWIDGAWSAEKMNEWVRWLKSIGYRDVIPSLNFSTDHDVWLGEYSRMVSTSEYYKVCADLIRDTWEVFEKPRIFNYGMDEEFIWHMVGDPNHKNGIVIARQGDLYWHDNLFFIKEIEKLGSRAFCWADKVWNSREGYLKNVPKSVLQSNWCYAPTFTEGEKGWQKWHKEQYEAYDVLEKAGYDQVPGCSNWIWTGEGWDGAYTAKTNPNIWLTFKYCKKHIAPERLKGFHVMSWNSTAPAGDANFFLVCDMMRDAISAF